MKKSKAKKKKIYKQRGSNHDLRMAYLDFNKRFFSNKLPKDMPVRFAHIPGDLGLTTIHTQTFRPLYIRISESLKSSYRNSCMTLLHEMVHVLHPERRGCKNNPGFERDMLAIAKKGAFKGIW